MPWRSSSPLSLVTDTSRTPGSGGLQVTYQRTDGHGADTYQVVSPNNGYGPRVLRVLKPTDPAPGVRHNFLCVLPVEAGLGRTYGDGFETMRALDAQNEYNLTIIEPTFQIEPWYADNPTDPNLRYETFMTEDLAPWVAQRLALTGHEQTWLIGFSKSGYGAQQLILKHPDVFTLAASWDFPADMSSHDQFGSSSSGAYGTEANFQANYRLTPDFLAAHREPFLTANRIWIGGYEIFPTDMSGYDALLSSQGVLHSTGTPHPRAHTWTSGWVPVALAALHEASVALTQQP